MSKADDIFFREFGAVLGALVLFTILMFFLARYIGGQSFERMQNTPGAIMSRIAPEATVRIGDPGTTVATPVPAPAQQAAAAAPAAASGESVYQSACVACHMAGVAGAPKFGDKAAWAPRIGLGMDALVASVVNGKGAMPPKAGNAALTDGEIQAAVQYMVDAASDAAASAAATATAAVQGVVEAAKEAASATAAGAAEAASTAAGTVEQVVEQAQQAVSRAAEQASAAVTATAGGEVAAAGKPGDDVYGTACVACHATGVANAPKLGDSAAWIERAGAGFDALVSSVVNGKGAMPPKGGMATLTTPDIQNAVRFMLEQSGVTTAGG